MPMVGTERLPGHGLRHRGGNGFQHDRETAGVLQRKGVVAQLQRRLGAGRLHLVAPQLGGCLRRQPDVAHRRHASGDDGPHGCRHLAAALQLHRVHVRLLQVAPGVADRLAAAHLVGHERHVADQQGARRAARHRLAVVQHLVHGHRHRVAVAQHGHGQGVADQDGIHPRLVHQLRRRVVVRRQHGDRPARVPLALEVVEGNSACHGLASSRAAVRWVTVAVVGGGNRTPYPPSCPDREAAAGTAALTSNP